MNMFATGFLAVVGVVALVFHRQIRSVAVQVQRLAHSMHKEFHQ